MRRAVVCASLAVLASHGVFAQSVSTPSAFEVASVKPNAEGRGREQVQSSPTNLIMRKASLRFFIHWAYELRLDQISGPGWLNTERYDVAAKTDSPSTEQQLRLMLQTLLAERFKLVFHRETKILPVYELVAGKGSSKLREAKGDEKSELSVTRASYALHHASMSELAERLVELGAVDHPVADRTGIQGSFDFSLSFPEGWRPGPTSDRSGISIFSILEEQLGLKLELRKSPVETLVVDQAERPSEN